MGNGNAELTITDAFTGLSNPVRIERGEITVTVMRGKNIQHILFNLAGIQVEERLTDKVNFNVLALLRPTKTGTHHPFSHSDFRAFLSTLGEHPDPVVAKKNQSNPGGYVTVEPNTIGNQVNRGDIDSNGTPSSQNLNGPKGIEDYKELTSEQRLEIGLNENSRKLAKKAAGERFEVEATRKIQIAVVNLFEMNRAGLLLTPALNEALNSILDVTAGNFHRSIGKEAVLGYINNLSFKNKKHAIALLTKRVREKLNLSALELEDRPLLVPFKVLSSDMLAKMSEVGYQVMRSRDFTLRESQISRALEKLNASSDELVTLLTTAEERIELQEAAYDTIRVADMKKDPRGKFVNMVLAKTGKLNPRTGELSGGNLFRAMNSLFKDYGDDLPQIFFDLRSELIIRLKISRLDAAREESDED